MLESSCRCIITFHIFDYTERSQDGAIWMRIQRDDQSIYFHLHESFIAATFAVLSLDLLDQPTTLTSLCPSSNRKRTPANKALPIPLWHPSPAQPALALPIHGRQIKSKPSPRPENWWECRSTPPAEVLPSVSPPQCFRPLSAASLPFSRRPSHG